MKFEVTMEWPATGSFLEVIVEADGRNHARRLAAMPGWFWIDVNWLDRLGSDCADENL